MYHTSNSNLFQEGTKKISSLVNVFLYDLEHDTEFVNQLQKLLCKYIQLLHPGTIFHMVVRLNIKSTKMS